MALRDRLSRKSYKKTLLFFSILIIGLFAFSGATWAADGSDSSNIIQTDDSQSNTILTNYKSNSNTKSVPKAVNNAQGIDPNDQKDILGAPTLTVTKTANKDPAKYNVGENVVFTINVQNPSTTTFYLTGLRDYLPNGLTYVSNTGGGSYSSILNRVLWDMGTVRPGDSRTYTMTANVNSGQEGKEIENSASAVPTYPINIFTGSKKIYVYPAILEITKSAPTTINAGETLSYTINIKNKGAQSAQDVHVLDTVATLTGVTWTLDGINQGAWTGDAALGTMTLNQEHILVISGIVPANTAKNTQINNIATATSPSAATVTDDTSTTVNTSAVLEITKTGPASVYAGNYLSYTINVTNNGPSDAQNVHVLDTVPVLTGVTWTLDGISQGAWTGDASLGVMTPLSTHEIILTGYVAGDTPKDTPINNIASATSPTAQTVSDDACTTVDTHAVLEITKTGPATVIAGNSLSYTINVTNNGPSDAQNVHVLDNVPVLTGVTWTLDGISQGAWTGDASLGVMTILSTHEIILTGTVPASTAKDTLIHNVAKATSPTSNDVEDYQDTTVNTCANLEITKDAPATVIAGNNITYTIKIKNNGPSDAQNVVVTDNVSLENCTWTLDGISQGAWTGSALLGVMNPNQEHIIVINGIVLSGIAKGTVIHNIATGTSPTAPEVQDSADTTVDTLCNLSVNKTGASSVTAGKDVIIFNIKITNTGPSDAKDVKLTDIIDITKILKSSLQYSLDGGINWSPWPDSNFLDLGTIEKGEQLNIQILGIVLSSARNEIINTASIATTTANQSTQTTSTSKTTVLTNAILTITKSGFPGSVNPGQLINYSINIKNTGPSDAQDVKFYDTLNSQLENGQYSLDGLKWYKWPSASGYLSLHTLAAGASMNVFIRATVSKLATKDFSNTARVTSPTGPNDKSSTTNTHLNRADVGVKKTVNNSTPNYMDNIIYTITATNYGPDTATGVKITDLLPTGLRYLSSTPSQGGYNSQTGVWTIGTLAKNQIETLKLTVQVKKTGITENTATKTSENEYDPNPANNTSSVKINVPSSAALDINKTASNKKPRINDTVYFTYVLRNNGPDTALKVYVDDVLPTGLTYVSSTADYGKYNPNNGIWTIGSLPVGKTAKLVIESIVTRVGDITNKAKVYSITYDPVTPNPEAEVTITVEPKPKPKPAPPTPNHHGKTVPMQETGFPITAIITAFLFVLAGLGISKKR